MTGAHERWLFSTLYLGAKRVLTGSGSASQAEERQAEPVSDDEDPMSGVRTRDQVDELLATSVAPRARTKTGG